MFDQAMLGLAMAWVDRTQRRPLFQAAATPETVQLELLKRLLAENAETAFGRRHSFAKIRGWQDFRAAVPVQTYEELREYVDAQAADGSPCLTAARPIGYARTSGTAGVAKDIPVTASCRAQGRYAQLQTALTLHRHTGFFDGQVVALGGGAAEGQRVGGTYGAASGQAYHDLPVWLRRRFVVPPAVFEIADYDLKYYTVVLLALASGDVTGLATANPSSLVRLRDVANEHRTTLAADLRGEPSAYLRALAPELAATVRTRLRSTDVGRAVRVLEAPKISVVDLWPKLAAVLTWTGGSCGVALHGLSRELPEGCRVVELGYRASEVVGTVPLDASGGGGLPLLRHSVFEFVERDDWEAGKERFVTLAELTEGSQYYVFVTTAAGLYRYDMNDIVEVTGRVAQTPKLAFVQKGKGVTNIAGEKLSEGDVIAAAKTGLHGIHGVGFVALVGDETERCYDLLVEQADDRVAAAGVAEAVDGSLRRRNVEYDAKRASGRLGPVRLTVLRSGAAEFCKRQALRRGQREAQYKPICLALRRDWPVDLTPYVVSAER